MKTIILVLMLFMGHSLMAQYCSPIDYSFGVNGLAQNYDPPNANYPSSDIAVGSGGSIVQLVSVYNGMSYNEYVQGFLNDGKKNIGVGNNGIATVASPIGGSQFSQIEVAPDGKYVLAGVQSDQQGNSKVVLCRLMPDGRPDPGFGDGGFFVVSLPPGFTYSYVNAIVVKGDGKIIVSGYGYKRATLCEQADYGYPAGYILGIQSDGKIDTGFGSGGWVLTESGSYSDDPTFLTIQSDGKIMSVNGVGAECKCEFDSYYGSYYWSCAKQNLLFQRFLPDGKRDLSFGNAGKMIDLSWGTSLIDLAVSADGSIYTVGHSYISGYILFVKKFLASGLPDLSYGQQGVATINTTITGTGQNTQYYPTDVAIQPDGKVVLSAAIYNTNETAAIFRLSDRGVIDQDFFGRGWTNLWAGDANQNRFYPASITMQGADILIGGNASMSGSNTDVVIMRISSLGGPNQVDIKPSGPADICNNDTLMLSTTTAGTYQWYINGSRITGATQPQYPVSGIAGSYSVQVKNANACGVSPSVQVKVSYAPALSKPEFDGTAIKTVPGYARYEWYLDNKLIAGANGDSYMPGSVLGTYKAKAWASNGCSSFSPEFIYVVTGIADISLGDTKMRYYPNPARSELHIDVHAGSLKKSSATLYDVSGRLLFSGELQSGKNTLDLSKYRNGLYTLILKTGNEEAVRKLMIAH